MRDALFSLWTLLRRASREFLRLQGVSQAAALSFYALLSFIPLVFLALSIAGRILGDPQRVRSLFDQYKDLLMPEAHNELYAHAVRLLESSAGLGWMSLGFILWTSGLFFASLQSNLLLSWPPAAHPSGWLRRLLPWVLGPAFGFLLPVAMLAMHVASFLPWRWLPFEIAPEVWTWAFLSALIFLIYILFLPRRLPWLATGVLALTMAGGSQILTLIFVKLISTLPNYALVYGSLAGLVLFLLWLEYNMALILWGGHCIRLWKEMRGGS